MSRRPLFAVLAVVGAPCALAACSLINSYDDVVPFTGASDGSTLDQNVSPDGNVPPDSNPGSDDALPSVDAGPKGPLGVIAVGGEVLSADGGKQPVLTALNPLNGREINPAKRETMSVVALQHDGNRDIFYIFENTSGDVNWSPTNKVVLHVRSIDPATGVWTERQKLDVPSIAASDTIAVLRNRLAYFAYGISDAGALTTQLVVLDTTAREGVTVLAPSTPVPSLPEGLLGSRQSSGAGQGMLSVLRKDTTQCTGDAIDLCPFTLTPVTIPANGQPQFGATVTVRSVPRVAATPAWATYENAGVPLDVFAIPPIAPDSAYVIKWKASTNVQIDSKVSYAVSRPRLSSLAIAECAGVALSVELTSSELFAVPLSASGGTPVSASLANPGQAVRFEPYTNTVLTPYKQGGAGEIAAYTLAGTATAPTLTKRKAPNWEPPADVLPNIVTVKQLLPLACP